MRVSLNPFVQVFYSNTEDRNEKTLCLSSGVLIPLFRSFILIGDHLP